MKRGISILIVSVFLLHFAGFYLYFIIRLQSVRAEAKALLQTEELQTITLSKKDYQLALIEEDEMEWQGNRYDIATITYQENTVMVKALLDKDETELFEFLEELVNVSGQQKVPISITGFTFLSFTLPGTCLIPDLVGTPIQSCHPFYLVKYNSIKISIPSPPPWRQFT